jgi:hypothetical protein
MTEQTNTPELSVEQQIAEQIAALEQRVVTLPPQLQQIYREVLELTRNRERIRQLEARTKIVPPAPPRSAPRPAPTSQAEPSPERPSGWAKFDAIGPPPGIDHVDRLCAAQDVLDRAAREREYLQYFLDRHHEAKLNEKEYARAQAEHSCHRGPGDPDYPS